MASRLVGKGLDAFAQRGCTAAPRVLGVAPTDRAGHGSSVPRSIVLVRPTRRRSPAPPTPALDFPADFLRDIATDVQQGGATIDGVTSQRYGVV